MRPSSIFGVEPCKSHCCRDNDFDFDLDDYLSPSQRSAQPRSRRTSQAPQVEVTSVVEKKRAPGRRHRARLSLDGPVVRKETGKEAKVAEDMLLLRKVKSAEFGSDSRRYKAFKRL
jgi:hypothetical protein